MYDKAELLRKTFQFAEKAILSEIKELQDQIILIERFKEKTVRYDMPGSWKVREWDKVNDLEKKIEGYLDLVAQINDYENRISTEQFLQGFEGFLKSQKTS